jgi:hypothetical protein
MAFLTLRDYVVFCKILSKHIRLLTNKLQLVTNKQRESNTRGITREIEIKVKKY